MLGVCNHVLPGLKIWNWYNLKFQPPRLSWPPQPEMLTCLLQHFDTMLPASFPTAVNEVSLYPPLHSAAELKSVFCIQHTEIPRSRNH